MRALKDITPEEIGEINKILSTEYHYNKDLHVKNAHDIEYQVFSKSRSIFSGYGVVAVYEYLNRIKIDLFKK